MCHKRKLVPYFHFCAMRKLCSNHLLYLFLPIMKLALVQKFAAHQRGRGREGGRHKRSVGVILMFMCLKQYLLSLSLSSVFAHFNDMLDKWDRLQAGFDKVNSLVLVLI